MEKPRNKRTQPALPPEVLAEIWQTAENGIPTDVLGSYTGTAQQKERPVQDADDL